MSHPPEKSSSFSLSAAASALPVIAIVGRPNVGKSALFNRIAKKKIAIVHEQPGVTRDRVATEAEWCGRRFLLIDTGGIALGAGEKTNDVITAAMREQAQRAIEQAVALIFVVDVTDGVTAWDKEVAAQLRQSNRPVLLAVNKVDNAERETAAAEFAQLGFTSIFPISALHGIGVDALLDAATANIPPIFHDSITPAFPPPASTPLTLAIVGRPNVGKSSLVNRLLNEERLIVTDVPGTTRDAVDVPFRLCHEQTERDCVLIDTAGIRHVSKVRDSVEVFSVMRSRHSIDRCDVAVLVADAMDGITSQDKRIGGMISEAHKGCVIAVNKWDLFEDVSVSKASPPKTRRAQPRLTWEECEAYVRRELFFINYAPIIFISALKGRGLKKLLSSVLHVDTQLDTTVQTAVLNKTLEAATDAYQSPRGQGGRRLKIYYGNQIGTRPPTFLIFCNDPGARTPHYERYLADRIRRDCGMESSPVKLIFRGR